jgi:hypothetical protein
MPETGRTIGHYEVLGRVGRGGMAVVHLARQVDLQRLVALKELRALHDDDPSCARRFLREAQMAGSLSDPNVVTVYEYLEHDGTPYMAMEYLERGSLRPYVGTMNLAQVSGVLEGILAALVSAERSQIVHRDLKPENVLVTVDGRVKVADFGIAKASGHLHTGGFRTASGVTLGTPHYIAPEQALAGNVGPWTDLYSVGCMAFELFTGHVPFAHIESPMTVLMHHVNEPIPPVKDISEGVDERISDWIERLLVKAPDQRIQSPAEAWDGFEEIAISLLGARWRRDARLWVRAAPDEDADRSGASGPGGATAPTAARGPYTPPPADLPAGPLMPVAETTPAPRLDAQAVAHRPRGSRRRRGPAVAALAAAGAGIALAVRDDKPEPPPARERAAIPETNLTVNPSFERVSAGWDAYQSKITRERASDAPAGRYIARVALASEPDEYSIDDEPETVSSSVRGRAYTATAWVKATPETDGNWVCIAIREHAPGAGEDSWAGVAQGHVVASTAEFRQARVTYVARADAHTIGVHVFRYPPVVGKRDAFLVDAITMTEDLRGGVNEQLVRSATCHV